MTTKPQSRNARRFLEGLSGGALTLGQLLEAIRKGEQVSPAKFAEVLGISKSHLCDIEKGRKTVSPGRAARFAKKLGYSDLQFVRLSIQEAINDARLPFVVEVKSA